MAGEAMRHPPSRIAHTQGATSVQAAIWDGGSQSLGVGLACGPRLVGRAGREQLGSCLTMALHRAARGFLVRIAVGMGRLPAAPARMCVGERR